MLTDCNLMGYAQSSMTSLFSGLFGSCHCLWPLAECHKNPSMGLFLWQGLALGKEEGRVELIGVHLIFDLDKLVSKGFVYR